MIKLTSIVFLFLLSQLSFGQSEIVSKDILLKNDSIQLPGTLSYDKSITEQPLAIFIHGSGGVDRNGNQGPQYQANYIKQLSEALNKQGVAFYRYDKRTSNMANAKFLMQGVSFQDLIDDVLLAVEKFKDDPRFSSIVLIGHSQGSLIGMLASKVNINKYVSLAGPSESFDTTLVAQIRTQHGDEIASILKQHFDELKTTGDITNLDSNFAGLFNPLNKKFFKGYIHYLPTEEIKNVTIPTLIINGTMDLQVLEKDAKALHNAKPDAELKIIENLNHVLKTVITKEDNETSYKTPDFPLSKVLVETLVDFIKK